MDTERFTQPAHFEPVAAALRSEGYDAVVDDAGHANYVVRVTIPDRTVAEVLVGCEDGAWGLNYFDADGDMLGGMSFTGLDADHGIDEVVTEVSRVLFDIDADRDLFRHGVRT